MSPRTKVCVVGMGMGDPSTLTIAARSALERSELIIGSPRLIDSLAGLEARKLALLSAEEIERELRAWADEVGAAPDRQDDPAGTAAEPAVRIASVVMSGDIGFYSGATRLLERISDMDVETIAGISSLAYLCARLRTTWQDAYVVSVHGRSHDVAGAVQTHAKVFLLTDGQSTPNAICRQLVERGLADVCVSVGERLSYGDERVTTASAQELAEVRFAQPAVMLVRNDHPMEGRIGAPHLTDDAFCRGTVPMTKEEVRELAVCKLRIRKDDVVWDVGAGTGSVSVECARAALEGQVLAIERDAVACDLVRRNGEAFGLGNLRIVEGEAPDALRGLPRPDRVFVGGSGGKLAAILRLVLEASPDVRVCIAAITLETLTEALGQVRELDLRDIDIVQLSVAKAREVGSYHMMQATNPIFLVTADGPGVRAVSAEPTVGPGDACHAGVSAGR